MPTAIDDQMPHGKRRFLDFIATSPIIHQHAIFADYKVFVGARECCRRL
jgi:hypothetical protein